MWTHIEFRSDRLNWSCKSNEYFNEFDILLRMEWDRAMQQGLFTFHIDHQTKRRILDDGDLNYIIQLNSNRFVKRRPPYPFDNVNTPFDKNKFNFNQIQDAEILLSLDHPGEINRQLVIINNSPIHPYHVLLVPDRQLELPQVLTTDGIRFGLEFVASSAHPFIFAGFNSLCGYASINHLHFHGLYVPGPMFVQTIKCSVFHRKSRCYLLDSFDTQAFAFEIEKIEQFDQTSQHIHAIINYLSSNNIAHSLSIVKGESFASPSTDVLRVFLWIRQSVLNAQVFERCNFACLELSGFMTLQHEEVFHDLTEMEVREGLNNIALPLDKQKEIKDAVLNLLEKFF